MFNHVQQCWSFRGFNVISLVLIPLSAFIIQTSDASSSLSQWGASLPFSQRHSTHTATTINRNKCDKRNVAQLEVQSCFTIERERQDQINSSFRPRSRSLLLASSLRGGSSDSEYSDSDYSDSDFFDDDSLDFDLDTAEGDFQEDNTLTRAWDAFQKSPPLTKLYLSASFTATAIGYLTNKNEFPPYLLLDWKATTTRLQIWRPFTAFLNFGPLNLGYLMTSHFVWTYMATLERLNHDTPYEFWWMMLFGGTTMIFGYAMLQISPKFLGHNLSTFFVYVWSRYHEGLEVNMFDMLNTRAETLPWFFLAQTFLLEGEPPILDLLGILFGHVYHYGRSVGIGKAPRFVKDWYENGKGDLADMVREEYKKVGSDFVLQ